MASMVKGTQQRQLEFGYQVTKTVTPPNSGSTGTLFTVSGGVVAVTSFFGRVSTVLSGTTGTIILGTAPTVGTANTSGIGGTSTPLVVGGAEVGTFIGVYSSSGIASTALAIGASKQAGMAIWLSTPFVVNAGTITITTGVATMTGAITWYLTYAPMDNGASVS